MVRHHLPLGSSPVSFLCVPLACCALCKPSSAVSRALRRRAAGDTGRSARGRKGTYRTRVPGAPPPPEDRDAWAESAEGILELCRRREPDPPLASCSLACVLASLELESSLP
ncbi:hypothetical protein U9M48_028316 [Paspalum notatum var. saurae]|uniref:Secreted protein n=1 Tax=Paspalum notatum var. saurae TaxID=547442 RepID=A0AAQ3X1E7_PASNO